MFVVNGTLVIFVASFLLFMVLLNEIMLKPVGRVMLKRQEKAKADHERANQARQEASGLVENYEQKLKSIRSQAHSDIASAAAAAAKDKSERLAAVQKDGFEKLEQAKAEIASHREKLIDELVSQEQELVEAITHKILGEPVAVHVDASKIRKNLEGGV